MSKELKAAIEANDPDAVRKALPVIKDINRKLPKAQAPLLYACEKGADKVLEALFAAGAIAEKRHTFPGDTPFAVAAHHRQFEVMKHLLALKQASACAVEFVLQNACLDGKVEVLEFLLQHARPPITIELFRLATVTSKGPALVKLLVKYGGDVRMKYDMGEAKAMTPLHELCAGGNIELIQTLIDCGAEVNTRDGLGRTPLMVLAGNLERIEQNNENAVRVQEALASGKSRLLAGEAPRTVDAMEALRLLLKSGADATLADHSGNGIIDHCAFEYFREKRTPDAKYLELFRSAGAKGSPETLELFAALKKKDPAAVRAAIKKGADVNRLLPPPGQSTPLTWASGIDSSIALNIVLALLEAGADPNKFDSGGTPLIRAAGQGNLEVVKELIAAGADIHAVYQSGEYIQNAYSAAERNDDVRNHLKSLGAANPVRPQAEPLKPGVESWNDFRELLVKCTVDKAATAIAGLIKGKARSNVYGQSFTPGKRAYVVIRPKGMNWCNVFQIAPPRLRFEDSGPIEAFAAELTKASGAAALSIEYSDTSDAASIVRIEPDGTVLRDEGWDHDTLEEMVGEMGDEAPGWARKKLAKTDEDDLRSTERVVQLAEQEKFVVAAFGFYCEPGRKLELEIRDCGEEMFDGVAFVSD